MKTITLLLAGTLLALPFGTRAAQYYQGTTLSWGIDSGTYVSTLAVPDSGEVTGISLRIHQCNLPVGDLENIAIQLLSPDGTSIYLFDGTSSQLNGPSLFSTNFTQDAAESITEGQSPYTGDFRPAQTLENFLGKEMNGTWQLAVTEIARGNDGSLTGWTLYINEPPPPHTPTPVPTPTPGTCYEAEGNPFAWERGGMWFDRTSVPVRGRVEDVTVEVSLLCGNDLSETGIYLYSPEGKAVALYKLVSLWGKGLAGTVFDDSAEIPIANGIQPYVGHYRPVESLSSFQGDWATGTWTLGIFSANDEAGGSVSEWRLNCCYWVPPTPTPSTTPSTTPVPSATPTRTPAGYKTPRPTRTPTPAPSPSPLPYCVYYPGVPVDVYPQDVEISSKYVSDNRKVASVAVTIGELTTEDEANLGEVGIYLYSPWTDDPVPMFELEDLSGNALYGTHFDDDAENSIAEGTAPYPGRWHPIGNLSTFAGQTIAGTWKLLVANGENECETGDCKVRVTSWGLQICAAPSPTPIDMPTPIPTPGTCIEFAGPSFSIEGGTVSDGTLTVVQEGKIRDIILSLEGSTSNDLSELTAYLISPENTTLTLFEMGNISGNALYRTQLGDSAFTLLKDGSAPYIGLYRPLQPFSRLDAESMTGEWTLAIYNSREVSSGQIEEWSLNICWVPPSPTPTPQPSPTPEAGVPEWISRASGDYNGDGTSDIGYFRPSLKLWSIRDVGTDFFGAGNDLVVSGDYDGDGTSEMAVFRPASGLWIIRPLTRFYFGRSGDLPVPRDYDGDGFCDPAVFREEEALWIIQGQTRFYFGQADDQPVPGDWDGDGTAEAAIRRPSPSFWKIDGVTKFYFGLPEDYAFPAAYAGAETLPAVFRPSRLLWIIRGLTRFYFGKGGDGPVPADYQGDGTADPAFFRGSQGLWKIRGLSSIYWGKSGDIPVTR